MDSTMYNYAIIGAGCAGIHIALAMMEDSFFEDKQVLVLEKDAKSVNDRTWCFWEVGEGKWDKYLQHSWSRGKFHCSKQNKDLEIAPYKYKMLRSIDFYDIGKSRIKAAPNFNWVSDTVITIHESEKNIIQGEKQNYSVIHIFDSRIHPDFFNNNDKYIRLLQHFKGWVIETEEDFFDQDQFVFMDFRLKWNNSTSFNYVLPITKRKALVEFTLFTPSLIKDHDYDKMLKKYLQEIVQLNNYKILEVEQGVIPMSNYPFHRHHEDHLTKIGTAGGWIRPSTGYHFKNAEKYSLKIVENLKNKKHPATGVANNKFRNYDKLFLDILNSNNEMGEELFSSMFEKNPTTKVFKFLDEETSFLQDLKIFSTFRSLPFLKAIYKQIRL